jgi:hypothetical protein
MAITALGGSTGIAKQFKRRVLIKNSRRPKKDGGFELKLERPLRPAAGGFDLRV